MDIDRRESAIGKAMIEHDGGSGIVDMTCKRCSHAPEAHHAGIGQCYTCPAAVRCVCWEPRNQLAKIARDFGRCPT